MTAARETPIEGPTLTRRQELGAASARSLLLTVLGEFVLPRGEQVWTSTLLELAADLDVAEKAARQALMRTADDGWIAAQRIGRETRWGLTEQGTRLLTDGTRRIYDAASEEQPWDGSWLVLTVTVPENARALRQRLRTQLGWAGLGSSSPGVWVTPRVDREAEAARVLEELGLTAGSWSFVARSGQIGDQRSLVRSAWDLDAIETRYEEFLELVGSRRPRTDRQALVAQVRLVQEWRRFPLLDPGLPRELLPPRWSGNRAAQVFRERHATWAPRARSAWESLARTD
ncbi:PaaX family transcriptional regulator [Geodermatophilus sp. Leaf369]|uniref:PaaX family transcriptional regulator n=1 Tax=Geodermatophilus sp. Leaf369 TaxID=1736354 RepID=UPI0006F6DA1C|nr:PaaX family transcriptional regulator C-terminal domain-containing protein [Geodermatophilus sp. Leaf369]KQS59639.1 PaaX family transcriptional regulator [Geodermatophilus sp. Leaf369]QNG38369.1 PaaX family transcriptional regulator [Geodermatophilaceae bacterium NBWT11]